MRIGMQRSCIALAIMWFPPWWRHISLARCASRPDQRHPCVISTWLCRRLSVSPSFPSVFAHFYSHLCFYTHYLSTRSLVWCVVWVASIMLCILFIPYLVCFLVFLISIPHTSCPDGGRFQRAGELSWIVHLRSRSSMNTSALRSRPTLSITIPNLFRFPFGLILDWAFPPSHPSDTQHIPLTAISCASLLCFYYDEMISSV
jgi:hypothetical protein